MDDVGYGATRLGIKNNSTWAYTGSDNILVPRVLVKKLRALIIESTSSDGVHYTVPCSTQTP